MTEHDDVAQTLRSQVLAAAPSTARELQALQYPAEVYFKKDVNLVMRRVRRWGLFRVLAQVPYVQKHAVAVGWPLRVSEQTSHDHVLTLGDTLLAHDGTVRIVTPDATGAMHPEPLTDREPHPVEGQITDEAILQSLAYHQTQAYARQHPEAAVSPEEA